MLALLEREKSGKGQWLLHLAARGADLHARLSVRALAGRCRRSPNRRGTTTRRAFPPGFLQTADGHMNIAVAGTGDLGPVLPGARPGGLDVLIPISWMRRPARKTGTGLNAADRRMPSQRKPPPRGSRAFNGLGVPCGPIYNIGELFADPNRSRTSRAGPAADLTRTG